MRAFLLALVWPATTVLAAQCYFPNGKAVNSDTACNPNALVSACCYDNQACLSNGLCVSDPHDPVKARLHRGTCTDAQWKSGNCPRHCLDVDNNGVPVYSCNSTTTDSYCCYDGCDCKVNSGFEIFTFAQSPADVYTLTIIGEDYTQTHTSAASSTATSASPSLTGTSSSSAATSSAAASTPGGSTNAASPSTSPTSAPATSSPSPAASPPKAPSSSNGVALGVGLGIGLPVAALLGVGLFFFLRRRKNRNPYATAAAGGSSQFSADADEYALSPQLPSERYAYVAEKRQAAPTAATTAIPIHEMSGEQDEKIAELPVTGKGAPSRAGGKAQAGPAELYSP